MANIDPITSDGNDVSSQPHVDMEPVEPAELALSIAPLNSMPNIDPITSDGNDVSSQPQGDMELVEPAEPALSIVPLNSVPSIDPITSDGNDVSSQPQGAMKLLEPAKPALVFLPTQPTEEQESQILSVTPNGVILTGSAAIGTVGSVVEKMDIVETKDTYLFRVSLPGVAKDDFTCDVVSNGQIFIKGVITTGEKVVYKDSMKFEMQSQNLCSPGEFSLSFQLPGPVDLQDVTTDFGIDGIFEGIVKKKSPSN